MIEFIAVNLPIIICFLVGVALLVLEVFMPGFGVPGITGIILEIVSIALTWRSHGPIAALGMVILVLAVIGITISLSLRSATKGRLSRSNIILNNTETVQEGYSATEDMDVFLGKEGTALTVLRPAGIAAFDGVKLNVVSEGEYIPKDTRVRIERVEGARVVVRALQDESNPA